ncbi:hypothetical protein HZA96_04965 [Candidatus Woesearchaeota archaeon]|nr:hypothetical protein [Candidatus Woesearchaeota archaeon]
MGVVTNKHNLAVILCLGVSLFISLILLTLSSQSVLADSFSAAGHITLLAVSENGNNEQGNTADLYLEIRDGAGKVYLDTFPLSKIDTQLSTRFARDYACHYLDKDCSKLDFFYTIRSDSLIIGGPSAGAAASILTIALLDNQKLDQSIATTGTINSGGIIGPVGSIKAKIAVAAANGIKKVLIPKGRRFYLEQDSLLLVKEIVEKNESINTTNPNLNFTTDLYQYGKDKGVEVKEVLTIDEAMKEYTGIDYSINLDEIILDPLYVLTMNKIARDLCSRSAQLQQTVELQLGLQRGLELGLEQRLENNVSLYNEAIQLINRSNLAMSKGQSYAAASFCFGTNVDLNTLLFTATLQTAEQQNKQLEQLFAAVIKAKTDLNKQELQTITDLQAYLVVKERLDEAEDIITKTLDLVKALKNDSIYYNIAFSSERLYSAFLWSSFINHQGRKFDLNKDVIKEGCIKKIAETEERLQYLHLTYPYEVSEITAGIKKAYSYLQNDNHKQCLSQALKTKAEIDVILSVSGIDEQNLHELLAVKSTVINQIIAKQQKKNIFPILGYSYYEYAQSLADKDISSALIYAEYAIEFSNIEIYLDDKTAANKKNILTDLKNYFSIDIDLVLVFIIGILAGVVLASRNNRVY